MDLVKVRLRKDKNYVYCYLREDIILDEDYGKTWMQKKQIEYLRKQGKKVHVIGEEVEGDKE